MQPIFPIQSIKFNDSEWYLMSVAPYYCHTTLINFDDWHLIDIDVNEDIDQLSVKYWNVKVEIQVEIKSGWNQVEIKLKSSWNQVKVPRLCGGTKAQI